MNNLCIDIGNTQVKYLVFRNGKPLNLTRYKKLKLKYIKQLCDQHQIDHIAVSSVKKGIPSLDVSWPKKIAITILDYKTNIPITNLYKTPKTLGNDRLASVIGAHHLYPNKNIAIIDLGTCIKFDFIDKKGNYLGGNISPGVHMRIQSMHDYTSQLPLVQLKYNKEILGHSTESALQNGAVRGTIFEIESFIRRIKKKYGKLIVVFTGGDADFFASYINYEIFVNQNLVLEGLNKIIHNNEY